MSKSKEENTRKKYNYLWQTAPKTSKNPINIHTVCTLLHIVVVQYRLILPISFRVTSLALKQWYDSLFYLTFNKCPFDMLIGTDPNRENFSYNFGTPICHLLCVWSHYLKPMLTANWIPKPKLQWKWIKINAWLCFRGSTSKQGKCLRNVHTFCSGLNVISTGLDNITFPAILVTKVTKIYWYNTVSPYGTDLSPPNIIWIYPEKPTGIALQFHVNIITNLDGKMYWLYQSSYGIQQSWLAKYFIRYQ